eukprot:5725175-Prymnesium_polylepis.1
MDCMEPWMDGPMESCKCTGLIALLIREIGGACRLCMTDWGERGCTNARIALWGAISRCRILPLRHLYLNGDFLSFVRAR